MPLSSATIFYATLPVFIIVALGWLLRSKGKVGADALVKTQLAVSHGAVQHVLGFGRHLALNILLDAAQHERLED